MPYLTEKFVICVFKRVCNAKVEWENRLDLCVAHPLKKINYKIFQLCMIF